MGDVQDDCHRLFMHRLRKALSQVRQRRVIGSRFRQGDAQEVAKRETVVAAPGDSPVAGDAFKVTDEVHAEVDARRQRGTTAS